MGIWYNDGLHTQHSWQSDQHIHSFQPIILDKIQICDNGRKRSETTLPTTPDKGSQILTLKPERWDKWACREKLQSKHGL